MNIIKNRLKLLALGKEIVPVYIEDELFYKIKYLCKLIPKEEWSGVLFYQVEGSIKDLSKFKITLKDVYPMDKGTGGFTSYEFDENLVEYRMDNPETLIMQIGHIHSHNVMPTFFSGTDDDELTDNAPNHNYYLSVIVNNYMDFSIRIAFKADAKVFHALDEDGEDYQIKVQPQPVVFYYNAKINLKEEQIPVTNKFADSVKHIIQEKERKEREMKKKQEEAWKKGNGSTQQKELPFKTSGSEDDYDANMHDFIIDLLGQNTPIILVEQDLHASLVRIATTMEDEHKPDYVASTVSDYPELYSAYFGGPTTSSVAFMEDLSYVIDNIDEANETIGSDVIETLLTQLRLFAEEFENAEL